MKHYHLREKLEFFSVRFTGIHKFYWFRKKYSVHALLKWLIMCPIKGWEEAIVEDEADRIREQSPT